jgi:DeoR/GlpR family transcriptional regulator of sugar metabolism
MLGERGVMSPSELAQHFNVSVMTIHRDLNELQRRGIIVKSHGGVTPQPAGTFESTLAFREGHMVEAKQAIAAKAAELVVSGGSVLLDDSTTTAHLVPHLLEQVPVTVATNFLPNLRPLAGADGVSLIALGGDHDPSSDAFTGMVCLRDIAAVRVDTAFVSAAGVSGGAAWHGDPQLVAVKQAMLESAERAYLLVDHSKLGRNALHEIGELARFTAVITDSGATDDQLAELREHAVDVVVA